MLSPVHLIDLAPRPPDFRSEVLEGLSRPRKSLPPKFFYDAEGCRLFEAICDLPEYYLTRAEIEILTRHAGSIAATLGPDVALIELGSGNSRKIRLLLDVLRPRIYLAVDIARDHLLRSASSLAEDHPWLEVHAVSVDYSQPFILAPLPKCTREVVFFPGSSIGNFEPAAAVALLRNIAGLVGDGGGLLIGFDLKKDPAVLNRAYNDSRGLTAAFNLNILRRINRELKAGFDLQRFRHRAFFNEDHGRVEMHLVSVMRQSVPVAGKTFAFEVSESIHTENSYKYSIEEFRALSAAAGFEVVQSWFDAERLFCLQFLARVTG